MLRARRIKNRAFADERQVSVRMNSSRADVNADGKINVVDLVLAREQMRR